MNTKEMPVLISAAPVLPSLDIERTVAFYCNLLWFHQSTTVKCAREAAPRRAVIGHKGILTRMGI